MGRASTTATAIGAVAALAATFTAGVVVGGSDDGSGGAQRDAHRVVAAGDDPVAVTYANADLRAPESCDDLLDWYVERGVERVTAYGWDSPIYYAFDGVMAANARGAVDGIAQPLPQSAGGPETAAPRRATSSATGTNVQEVGVDEPDVVKTDGALLVRVQDSDLVVYDVTAREPERLSAVDLGHDGAELLLVGDRVVVLDGHRVLVVDVSDPEEPEVVDDATYGARLVTARQHGDVVRLVLDAGLPELDFVEPSGDRTERSALEHNKDVVRDSELSDWLPGVTRDDETEGLLDCSDVALPTDEAGLGTLAVVGLDPATPDTWSTSALATSSDLAYFSPDRMVLATGPAPVWGCCLPVMEDRGMPAEVDGRTRLYVFDLDGTDAAYVASGSVDGSVRDRWAMDEVDGVLRVAVGPTQRTGDFNSVITLEQDGTDLVEIGRVDKLGVGETIRSVRWFDDLAWVVTFRQTDPLYAVDLSDPSAPALLGKLKIPGYSEYLHPLGDHRLLGLGQAASMRGFTRGARAALFNVTDLSRPRALDSVDYRPGSVAGAGADPRQFTWLPERRTALTVISKGSVGRTGWVSVLTLDGGAIENRMVEVEYGVEVDDVRTVPLPDGRVLLVTGDGVSDFPL